MSESVVYAIRHSSGKQYVGSTARWKRRRSEHLGRLRSGRHCNKHLQSAWAKYGEAEFSFVVLEVVDDPAQLIAREQHWIDATSAVSDGYNLCAEAGSRRGIPHTEEHKAKISAAKQGHRHSAATKERIRAARATQTASVAEMHAANRGRPRDEATRQKIAASHRGKEVSAATRAKIREANLGKKQTPETRQKRAEALRAAWARKKALLEGPGEALEDDFGDD